MARQDHIRHQVDKVRTEARSLIQRYRDERLEKARTRGWLRTEDAAAEGADATVETHTPVEAIDDALTVVSEAVSTITNLTADPASLFEATAYLASPDIERYVRSRAQKAAPATSSASAATAAPSPQKPAPTQSADAVPAQARPEAKPAEAPRAKASASAQGEANLESNLSAPQVGHTFLAALRDPSQLLGLEPLVVVPQMQMPRAPARAPQQAPKPAPKSEQPPKQAASAAAQPTAQKPKQQPSAASSAANYVVLSAAQASALGLTPLIVAPEPRPSQQARAAAEPAPPRPAAPARPEAAGIPITVLASVGPGLTLKLGELGITTLQDLAAANEENLREKLGPIGSLIQLDTWIAQARDLIASARRA